jgi:hypothetical protein
VCGKWNPVARTFAILLCAVGPLQTYRSRNSQAHALIGDDALNRRAGWSAQLTLDLVARMRPQDQRNLSRPDRLIERPVGVRSRLRLRTVCEANSAAVRRIFPIVSDDT